MQNDTKLKKKLKSVISKLRTTNCPQSNKPCCVGANPGNALFEDMFLGSYPRRSLQARRGEQLERPRQWYLSFLTPYS